MPGQGAIIGVGSIDYPAAYQAADPRIVAQLGLSKVITITSTYDHRIIQGAESGLFLKKVHELLLGEDSFYTTAFEDMGVPYEARPVALRPRGLRRRGTPPRGRSPSRWPSRRSSTSTGCGAT